MKTRRSLRPDDALLVGRLSLHTEGAIPRRPFLCITVWCPWCHDRHIHGWDDPPFRSDAVSHRVSHCHQGPLAQGGYWIGLDPAHAPHNRKIVLEMQEAYSRWSVGPHRFPGMARRSIVL